MKKRQKHYLSVIIILFLCIGIGYAYLSSTLNSSFFKALKKEKWYLIKCMRFLYLNKIKIFKILHR